MRNINTVAIIGSFKQHYREVSDVWHIFTSIGLEVTSPKGTPIIKESIPFVRFTSDQEEWDDPMVQTVALHRILRADFVLVIAPGGYIGRTTCYEVGRIVQAKRPLYFNAYPEDIPISIPPEHIISPDTICRMVTEGLFFPQPLYQQRKTKQHSLEKDLINGNFLQDDQFED